MIGWLTAGPTGVGLAKPFLIAQVDQMLEFIRSYLPYSATELNTMKVLQLKDLNDRAVQIHNLKVDQHQKQTASWQQKKK